MSLKIIMNGFFEFCRYTFKLNCIWDFGLISQTTPWCLLERQMLVKEALLDSTTFIFFSFAELHMFISCLFLDSLLIKIFFIDSELDLNNAMELCIP